jgi:catechol 2,3-dioxygenase
MSYHLVSQLSHVEMLTPKPDESLRFFEDVLGLQESHRQGQSVWLRAWGEFFHHSLKITEADAPGMGHAAWRVDGPDDLELAAQALSEAGVEGRWIDGDVGHGKAYQFTMPGGHRFELVWDFERYQAPPELRSVYPNRPQRQVAMNAAVRRIDHCTVMSRELQADKRVFVDALKFRYMEGTVLPSGAEIFVTLTSGAQNHDYAIVAEPPSYQGPGGRINHFCYYYDTRDELLRALDVLAENGTKIDMGPHKHGIGELFFTYVFEPGGNRIELQTGGYWNYIPDWEPVRWQVEQGGNFAWQIDQMPPHGTPPPPEAEQEAPMRGRFEEAQPAALQHG